MKFSVVIPTYNRAQKLMYAIESVLAQDYQDFEIVVVENISGPVSPETSHAMREYSKRIGDKIVYTVVDNEGVIAKSRNIGINLARGEFVAFLDDDDQWRSNKLSLCLKEFDDPDVVGAYHGMVIDGADYIPDDISYYKMLEFGNIYAPLSSLVVRKSECGLFDEDPELAGAEDFDFLLRLVGNDKYFVCIKEVLGAYASGGFSENHMRQAKAEVLALNREFARVDGRNDVLGKRTLYRSRAYLRAAVRSARSKQVLTTIKLALIGIVRIFI
jgi:glycosyltransferase involved in cell wall biosynthesis